MNKEVSVSGAPAAIGVCSGATQCNPGIREDWSKDAIFELCLKDE